MVCCSTCLSVDRRLYPLGEYSEVFSQVAGINAFMQNIDVVICWECRAKLRSVLKFQVKVQIAFNTLTQNIINPQALSTLTSNMLNKFNETVIREDNSSHLQTKIEDKNLTTDVYDESMDADLFDSYKNYEQNAICSKFTENIETVKSYCKNTEAVKSDCKNTEAVKSDCKNTEAVKSDCKNTEGVTSDCKKPRNNLWAQRRAIENKKVKYRILKMEDRKDIYERIQINEDELMECLKKERESKFYNDKHYKCEKCIIGFVNKQLLINHKKKRHKKGLGKYICAICKTRMSEKRHLTRHCRGHYYQYKCTSCGYTSWTRGHALWHYRHTHTRNYQCVKCLLTFVSRRELYSHYRERHERYICDTCGTQFKMRYCIVRHIKKRHGPQRCLPCGKTFARYNGLWLHNKLRHSTATSLADTATSLADTTTSLADTAAAATPLADSAAAYCVECDKHFANVYTYRWHLANCVRHTPRKKVSIPCGGCDKVFTKKIYMKEHFDLVHLHIYRHTCALCQKRFLRNADLVKHKRRVHDGVPAPRDKICYICGRAFTCNKILTNHIRVHTGERPFPCSRCPARFAQRAALLSHGKNVHKHTD